MTSMTRVALVEPSDEQLLAAVRLGIAMWDESPVYRSMTRDVDKMIAFAYYSRADPKTFFNVAVDGLQRVRGFFIGSIASYGYSEDMFAFDRLAYVSPDARGLLIIKALIFAFETWARDNGAMHVRLGTTTGVHAERTERLYNALGYTTVGVLTMKEIR